MQRHCFIRIEGITPYSQSRFLQSVKKPKEEYQAFEERVWKERMHVDDNGHMGIPTMALKYSVDEACKRLGLQVPGEGKTRYTKYMEAGWFAQSNATGNELVLIESSPDAYYDAESVTGRWLKMNSDGKKGGGKRVDRCYPEVPTGWTATVHAVLVDDKIPEHIFDQCFESAGMFVGIGRFRPEKQGYYGRFAVLSREWQQTLADAA